MLSLFSLLTTGSRISTNEQTRPQYLYEFPSFFLSSYIVNMINTWTLEKKETIYSQASNFWKDWQDIIVRLILTLYYFPPWSIFSYSSRTITHIKQLQRRKKIWKLRTGFFTFLISVFVRRPQPLCNVRKISTSGYWRLVKHWFWQRPPAGHTVGWHS